MNSTTKFRLRQLQTCAASNTPYMQLIICKMEMVFTNILQNYIATIIIYELYQQQYQLIIIHVKIINSKTKFHLRQLQTCATSNTPYMQLIISKMEMLFTNILQNYIATIIIYELYKQQYQLIIIIHVKIINSKFHLRQLQTCAASNTPYMQLIISKWKWYLQIFYKIISQR